MFVTSAVVLFVLALEINIYNEHVLIISSLVVQTLYIVSLCLLSGSPHYQTQVMRYRCGCRCGVGVSVDVGTV